MERSPDMHRQRAGDRQPPGAEVHDLMSAQTCPAWPIQLYPPRRSLLFVLSGPSGVGKDAVIEALKAEGYPIHFVVTATTRPRRPHEVDGTHYHFLTPDEFAVLNAQGGLIAVDTVYGYQYGTPVAQVREVLARGCDALLRIVQGAADVRRRVPGAVLIFLGPESLDQLVTRLCRRGTETPADRERRLAAVEREMACLPQFDYVVINREGRLAEAVAEVKAIITAERARVTPREVIV